MVSPPTAKTIGWIGLGSMGNAMAKNMQQHLSQSGGAPLRCWNRTAAKCDGVVARGGTAFASIAQLAQESDVIFISASDDDAVLSIVQQLVASGALADKIIVDTTTIHPKTTNQAAAMVSHAGAQFAAAPVFGATLTAEAGQLLVAYAGPAAVLDAISPLLKGVIAREVLVVGPAPEKALLLKTASNFMMAGLMELVAEGHVFAEKTGLGGDVLEKLLGLVFGSVAHSDSVRMTTGVYMPGAGAAPWSDLDLALKDVGHGVACARDAGVSLNVGNVAMEHLRQAKAFAERNGGRRLDSSALYGVVRMESGLAFENDFVRRRDGV